MTLCKDDHPTRRPRHDNMWGEWMLAIMTGLILLVHVLLWSSQIGLLP